MYGLTFKIYRDLRLIAGYFLREVQYRAASKPINRDHIKLIPALVPGSFSPTLHFTISHGDRPVHARDRGMRFLLSDDTTADEFARRPQTFSVNESPVLKRFGTSGPVYQSGRCKAHVFQ